MKALLLIFFYLFFCFDLYADNTESWMSAREIRSFLTKRGIKQKEQDVILKALSKSLNTPEESIQIHGNILFGHGWNGALFVDNDEWAYDLAFKSPETNKIVEIDDFINAYLYQGGIKLGFGYEWQFIILPYQFTLNELHQSVWGEGDRDQGRGIGIDFRFGVGIQVGWLESYDLPGNMFFVSPKVGAGVGIIFPKIRFKVKNIR